MINLGAFFTMKDYTDPLINQLAGTVFGSNAKSDISLRLKLNRIIENDLSDQFKTEIGPDSLAEYMEKIVSSPDQITDSDIEQLKADGFTEDQIYELTVSASLSCGLSRYLKATELLKEAMHATAIVK
ncbi:MAG: hypothetical protein KDD94_03535 [Calditrichaeota bacterium]|nr:hypothetical protein [Calditrichota bacterium]